MSQREPPSITNYEIGKTLGVGSFGKVKLARHKRTGEQVAVKIIEKTKFTEKNAKFQIKAVQREIKLLKLLNHKHVIRLFEVIETKTDVYVIMEYAPGGELFDYIVARKRLTEREARKFFRQIVSAVRYCHQRFVVHRDLKPENLLLSKDMQIKIIDFGLGNTFQIDKSLNTFCGSPAYASPEMIQGKAYNAAAVDVWSLGVLLYALICGCLPYEGDDLHALYKQILAAKYEKLKYISPEVDQLLQRMMCVSPDKRITIDELSRHPWLNKGYATTPIEDSEEAVLQVMSEDQIDEAIIAEVVDMGFDRQRVVRSLLNNHHNQETVCYYLINARKIEMNKKNQKISDLKSSLALPPTVAKRLEKVGPNNKRPSSTTPGSKGAAEGGGGGEGFAAATGGTKPSHDGTSTTQPLSGSHAKQKAPAVGASKQEGEEGKSEEKNADTVGDLDLSFKGSSFDKGKGTAPAQDRDAVTCPMDPAIVSQQPRRPEKVTKLPGLGSIPERPPSGRRRPATETNLFASLDEKNGDRNRQSSIDELRDAVAKLKLPGIDQPSAGSLNTSNESVDYDTAPAPRRPRSGRRRASVAVGAMTAAVPASAPVSPGRVAGVHNVQYESDALGPLPKHAPAPSAPTSPKSGKEKRRFSLDAAAAAIANKFGGNRKIGDESQLRVVNGVYSCSTTSNMSPVEVLEESINALKKEGVRFSMAPRNKFCIRCEKEQRTAAHGPTSTRAPSPLMADTSLAIQFELEVVRLPNLDLRGIILKRLKGNTWEYKNLCQRILENMSL